MEGDTTFKERLPPSIFDDESDSSDEDNESSIFEDESDSSDEDNDEVPHEDSDQEGPDELPPDEVDPDQEAPEEVDPDRSNSQKFDIDAVVTLAAALFTSKTSSSKAKSLRRSRANNLGRPDALLHERTVVVLDALAYLSVNKSKATVAIGLTMKPLQLLVTTNDEIPSTTILEHLDSICSTLQSISDAKFCTCSDPNSQSNADLRVESPPPPIHDENVNFHYNNLFLQVYKYSYDRLQSKNQRRWDVMERFREQMAGWIKDTLPEHRSDLAEPHKTFIESLNKFRLSEYTLRYHLDQFSRSGWKMDADRMDKLRNEWHHLLAHAKDVLGQQVGERSLCDHWARKVSLDGQPDNKKKELQLRRAIEKMVVFHRHVFTLIWFANSKRIRSSFFSSKITVIPAEETRPSVLSWPSNKREWGELLRSIYDKHELTRRSGVAVAKAEQKAQSKAEKCGVAEAIHCECAMVAYLHKKPALQAFSYIGVSRLSCKACHYWLEAFNGTMNTTFSTRGSHDKWYKGWARPGLGESANQGKVDAAFLNLVEEELCRHQLGQGMARKSGDSDSTVSSEQMISDQEVPTDVKTYAELSKIIGRVGCII